MSGGDVDIDPTESGGAEGSSHVSSDDVDRMSEDSVGSDGAPSAAGALKAMGYDVDDVDELEHGEDDASNSQATLGGFERVEIVAMLVFLFVVVFIVVTILRML